MAYGFWLCTPLLLVDGDGESVDSLLKVYTQLAREGTVVTQDGDTKLSLVLSSRRA